jgi:hypothetical protein
MTTDHTVEPGDLPRLRRAAYRFMRSPAGSGPDWRFQAEDGTLDITLPPDVAALPERERFGAHARQEARRIATAELYDLDPGVTAAAVTLGAAIYDTHHQHAVTLAGDARVAATLGIRAPARSGFMRWQGGIGRNSLNAQTVACHWGPTLGGGCWLAWWADWPAMAAAVCAQLQDEGLSAGVEALAETAGPLWYYHQELLYPPGVSVPDDGGNAALAPAAAEAGQPGMQLLYTTIASWSLLSNPGGAVQLTRMPVPAADQAADLAAGLRSSAVVVATAAVMPSHAGQPAATETALAT